MNLVIITQNDPFYLASNLDYLLRSIPKGVRISGCVLFESSPFGEKKTFFGKIKSTINIFGVRFFLHYGLRFCLKKVLSPSPRKVLEKYSIPIIMLQKSINHPDSIDYIKSFEPDLLVSILGNQIFKKPFSTRP